MVDQPPVVKPPRTIMALLLWLAVAGVLMLGTIAGIGYYFYSLLTPRALSDRAPGVVRRYPDGWTAYRFHKLAIEIDLPGAPKPENFDLTKWSLGNKIDVQFYGGYNFHSSIANGLVEGYVYRRIDTFRDKQYMVRGLERLMERDPNYVVTKTRVRDLQIGGVPCIEITFDGTFRGRSCIRRSLVNFSSRSYREIRMAWWTSEDKFGEEDWDRVERSVQFLPNEPDGVQWTVRNG